MDIEVENWWERSHAPWKGRLFDRMVLGADDKESHRVQRLREEIIESGHLEKASLNRARLFTESYKDTEGEPSIIRRAKAIYHALKGMPIKITPFQLLVGSPVSHIGAIEVEPEFMTTWLEEEIELDGKKMTQLDSLSLRAAGRYNFSKEDILELKEEILPYWRDRCHQRYVLTELERNFPETLYHLDNSEVVLPIIAIGIAHTIQDYLSVLKKGIKGIKEEIAGYMDGLDPSNPGSLTDFDRMNHYRAMLICADGLVVYANRCADEAERLALKEDDPERIAQLKEISRICRKVPENPAETWWEALQSWYFAYMATHLAEAGGSHSAGRFDQYMYPYLKKDLEQGVISEKKAQELLECLFVKFSERVCLKEIQSLVGFSGFRTNDKITIGGMDVRSRDATNDLSYMCLEAHAHVHLNEPPISLRVHRNTPEDFLKCALEVVRLGGGLPQIISDEVIIPSMVNTGVSLEDARNYADIGCQENVTDPNTSGADTQGHCNAGFFNLVKPIELALNNGVNPSNGKQVGPRTGDPVSIGNMDDFMKAVKLQFEYAVEQNAIFNGVIEYCYARYTPTPFHNLMHPGPRKTGIDFNEGGCKYNWTGAIGVGTANAGDCLSVIDSLIFREKTASWTDLLKALKADWVGYEELRGQCVSAPKYGTDDEYADKWTKTVLDIFFDAYESHTTPRGGKYVSGLFTMGVFFSAGASIGATPDGRMAGEQLADSVSPSRLAPVCGPISVHRSVTRAIDAFRTLNGITFNQKFSETAVGTERELSKWADLVMGYVASGGQSVQYNVIDRQVLLDAQKHPEDHKDLLVRVGGYSALFSELSREIQDDIIKRAEGEL